MTRPANRTMFLPLVALLALVLWLNGCVLDQKGMVLMIDTSYHPTMLDSTHNGFTQPDGLLWRQGKLLLADEGGSAVRVWSDAHHVRTLCDSKLGILEPEDLVADGEGNVFFTDDAAGGLWEIDRNGRSFQLAGKDKGLISTEGIVLAPSGDILVGDGEQHQVYRVSRSGNVSVFLGTRYGINKAESMVFDDRGNLYIADNHDQVVYLLTPQMKLQRVLENRTGFSPETIWYADHTLYITDSKNGKLSRYTPENGLQNIAVFGGKLSYVCGITTDDHSNIYVSIQSSFDPKIGYLIKLEHTPAS
ncbi:MAG TPA: hypothetical protein VFH88_13585 [Candidatus Krumholzibacteria bacterium]|nr:hypothetical protein [Candidatus Krumholzibacteria bacterium]